jgi:hypothetical protein
MSETKVGDVVDLSHPWGVVDARGDLVGHMTEPSARSAAAYLDVEWPKDAPHRVVKLAATLVPDPIPEAKSGWVYRVDRDIPGASRLSRLWGQAWVTQSSLHGEEWRDFVPPHDHDHVAAMLRAAGVVV